jgi:hypothetical protein
MRGPNQLPETLTRAIDQIEKMREELLVIQRSLEEFEYKNRRQSKRAK